MSDLMIIKCPVCNKEGVWEYITRHIGSSNDNEHTKYKNEVDMLIDKYLLETDYYFKEILEILINKKYIVTLSQIFRRENTTCPGRGYEIMAKRRTGNENPAVRKEVRQKISNTVSELWKEGIYNNRVNGMLGKLGKNNPRFNLYMFLGKRYLDIYKFYHGELKCSICNKSVNNGDTINIHHIDEDRDNFLLSNLEAFCVFHHSDKHYSARQTPFCYITKYFTFESSHNLLNYNGKCQNLHGHSYKLGVTIKKRINLQTGMVIDFRDLKSIVNNHIVEVLDHKYLNDVIPEFNTTAENMTFWIWNRLEKTALLKGIESIELWETQDSKVSISKKGMFLSADYALMYYNELCDHYNWEGQINENLQDINKEE